MNTRSPGTYRGGVADTHVYVADGLDENTVRPAVEAVLEDLGVDSWELESSPLEYPGYGWRWTCGPTSSRCSWLALSLPGSPGASGGTCSRPQRWPWRTLRRVVCPASTPPDFRAAASSLTSSVTAGLGPGPSACTRS